MKFCFSLAYQIHALVSRFGIFQFKLVYMLLHFRHIPGDFNKGRWSRKTSEPASTFLWKLLPKKPKFEMSVFCSNTLIFAPECWKCILRGSDFKIFPETRAFAASFFHYPSTPNFCHLLKILLKTVGLGKGVY